MWFEGNNFCSISTQEIHRPPTILAGAMITNWLFVKLKLAMKDYIEYVCCQRNTLIIPLTYILMVPWKIDKLTASAIKISTQETLIPGLKYNE